MERRNYLLPPKITGHSENNDRVRFYGGHNHFPVVLVSLMRRGQGAFLMKSAVSATQCILYRRTRCYDPVGSHLNE
jgi:hypothetical protein